MVEGKNMYELRRCTKAGDWYEDDPKKLNEELTGYLQSAKTSIQQGTRS